MTIRLVISNIGMKVFRCSGVCGRYERGGGEDGRDRGHDMWVKITEECSLPDAWPTFDRDTACIYHKHNTHVRPLLNYTPIISLKISPF